jgi:hypothetical protein
MMKLKENKLQKRKKKNPYSIRLTYKVWVRIVNLLFTQFFYEKE